MPRKKVTQTDTAPQEPTTETAETKPKRTRAKATTPEQEASKPVSRAKKQAQPAAVEVPTAEAPAKSGRRRPPKAAQPVVSEAPAKGRSRKKEAEPIAPPVAAEEPKKSRNRSRKKEAEPDLDFLQGEDISVTFRSRPKPEAPQKSRRDRRGKKPEPEQAAQPVAASGHLKEKDNDLIELEQLLIESFFPVPEWRLLKGAAAPKQQAASEEPHLAPRKSRRRRRRGSEEPEITAAAALAPPPKEEKPKGRQRREPEPKPVPVKPEKPVPPPKPLIPTPDDAPQIVLRNDIPTLVRNHRVYAPISFFGSASDERRAETVLEEIKMAGEAGVHIHAHLIEFEVDPGTVDSAVSIAGYLLAKTLQADPEAQVLFRVVFVAPNGWQSKYPNAAYSMLGGSPGEPSVSDDSFWGVARDALTAFIKKLRQLPNKDNILGLHLERGEWFYGADWGYDISTAARNKFRDWARTRYGDDVVALRAAWFDGDAQFATLQIPEFPREEHVGEKFVRSNRKERRWVDYHLFLSDAVVERIGDLAYAAKEASEGYFLIGASYGYTFEWSHPSSGHLSLGKLLRTPEIDFIAGPPSYRTREPGGAAPFPCPVDSFALNGKLYISEEDFKTSIGGRQEPDDFNPIIKTPQALESVHWRGCGSALAHAAGVCWMDLWGNGWLKTPSIWDRATKVRQALIRRMDCPLSDPDVAVFIDERALAYLVDRKAFDLLVQNVREAILRSGLSAAFYLLSDLQHREKFPESKLYVFLNAWDVRPELRAAIKTRLQRDNKVLFWLYSAGLFDSGRESLERAREVTGIALKPQPFYSRSGTTILNRRHPLCEAFPDKGIVGGAKLEPSYFAIPEEATVLGEYSQTGLPSFVVREFSHEGESHLNWTSVFLGEPMVTPALLRALGQMAGAHVWNYQEDVVHVRPPFLTVHCTGAGPRTLTLPSKWAAYNLLTEQWVQMDSTSVRFQAVDGSTHMFLVGIREELEAILSADPATLLQLETLPPMPENTIRFDAASFDVPIMKLDEWIGGTEGDELADDLLFKPRLIEEPDGESEKVGRRRRRRGRGRDGSEETAGARREGESFDEELGMSIVFRKRD